MTLIHREMTVIQKAGRFLAITGGWWLIGANGGRQGDMREAREKLDGIVILGIGAR